jgi:hypothetical protein
MPRVYSQARKEKHIVVIADNVSVMQGQCILATYVNQWKASKKGRSIKVTGGTDLSLMFSDGKLAATMWIDHLPTPEGENKFTAAVGPIPGLTVQP